MKVDQLAVLLLCYVNICTYIPTYVHTCCDIGTYAFSGGGSNFQLGMGGCVKNIGIKRGAYFISSGSGLKSNSLSQFYHFNGSAP